jgi:hypothetical protein
VAVAQVGHICSSHYEWSAISASLSDGHLHAGPVCHFQNMEDNELSNEHRGSCVNARTLGNILLPREEPVPLTFAFNTVGACSNRENMTIFVNRCNWK